MPPADPAPPSSSPPPKPPLKFGRSNWYKINNRARIAGSIVILFLFLIFAGAIGGYFYSQSHQPSASTKQPKVENLSQAELNQLSQVGSNLGATGQTLNIGANSLFRGSVTVGGDLSVNGRLSANGPVTLSQLNITGTTAVAGLNVGSSLNVTGTTTLQNALTVNGLTTVNGGLTVSGATSLNTLNAGTIAVHNISISGPLTIGHLVTQGPPPIIAADSVGSGGTVSISGNDTAGQVNINTGTGPGATLATITFRATYGSSVHVQLTALSGPAASAQTYVTRNNGGFQIHADTPPSGSVLSYDYFVTQ